MAKSRRPSLAPPPERTLFDVELVRGPRAGMEDVVHGYDLAGLLDLGGPKALTNRLIGLIELLEPHESLNEEQLTFVRGALEDITTTLWTFSEKSGDPARGWRVQPRNPVATAAA